MTMEFWIRFKRRQVSDCGSQVGGTEHLHRNTIVAGLPYRAGCTERCDVQQLVQRP